MFDERSQHAAIGYRVLVRAFRLRDDRGPQAGRECGSSARLQSVSKDSSISRTMSTEDLLVELAATSRWMAGALQAMTSISISSRRCARTGFSSSQIKKASACRRLWWELRISRRYAITALNVMSPRSPRLLCGRTVISTSWSKAVSIRMSRSTDQPRNCPRRMCDRSG